MSEIKEEGQEMNNGTGQDWENIHAFDPDCCIKSQKVSDAPTPRKSFASVLSSFIGYAIASSVLALLLAVCILCWRFLWWVVMT